MHQITHILRKEESLVNLVAFSNAPEFGPCCDREIEFSLLDASAQVIKDSLPSSKLQNAKVCIPSTQDVLRSKQDEKAVKQLGHLPNQGGFSLTGGCGHDLLYETDRKGAEPATMEIALADIPDRRYCLRIHFREGDYRLSVPSTPKRPSTNPGVPDDFDLTPADWQAYRTIF